MNQRERKGRAEERKESEREAERQIDRQTDRQKGYNAKNLISQLENVVL